MYILPAIDILDGQVVRLAQGKYDQVTVYQEYPTLQAQLFEEQGAEWLHVVDLNGAKSGSPDNIAIIEDILRKTSLKVEVGGGIRSLETIDRLLDTGIARVVLGTSLVKDEDFVIKAMETYGAENLVAGIDAKAGSVAVSGWVEDAGMAEADLVKHIADLGFIHLVYTDIARDGMRTGIDPKAYVRIAELFGHPVIASGGIATVDDIVALKAIEGSIEGCIAGRALYEGELSLEEAVAIAQGSREVSSYDPAAPLGASDLL